MHTNSMMNWINKSNKSSLVQNNIWSSAENYFEFLVNYTNNLNSFNSIQNELDEIFKNKNLKILELGCGMAWTSAYIQSIYSKNISEIHLLDMDNNFDKMSKDMFKLFQSDTSNVQFHNCDFNNIQFEQKFDVIILASSIHHFYDLDNLFKIFISIMSKGSTILIINENPINHFKFSYFLLKNYIHDFYKHLFNPNYKKFKRISHCGIEYDPELGDLYIPLRRYNYLFEKYNLEYKCIDSKLQQYKFMKLDHTLKHFICRKK